MRKLSLLALVLAVAACRDNGGGDDTPGPDSNTGGGEVTIQEVQNDSMVPGTAVTLEGVIITAIDNFGDRKNDIWVQEPGGGPYSGVQVYGVTIDDLAMLAVGDVVNISGAQKAEFALSADTSGNTLTELEPVDGGEMSVTKVSSGTVPTPDTVDALAIGQMTDFMARHAEWEKWEGVPVKLTNVAAFSDPECITSMGNCNDMTYERFDITGDIQLQSALAAMPTPKVVRGDCFASVTGIVTYFFDYQILPRTTAEIATGGTGCPTENQTATCGDSMDNDGNGFTDCNDNSCISGSTSCRTVMTISAIQTASTPPTGGVEIQNAYVTALFRLPFTNAKPRSMYIQANAAAQTNNGLLIFGNSSTDLSAYTVGERVNVIGKIIEFNDSMNMGTGTLTEMQLISHSAGTGANGNITPVTNQTATLLSVDAAGELHESVLVELQDVKLTVVGTMANFYAGTMVQGATTFKFDDDLHRLTEAANTCFDSIQGIWSYNVYDNAWYFLPNGVVDTTGGNCP